jgi:hypothetical protein
MAKTKQAETERSKAITKPSQTSSLAGRGLGSETAMDNLLDAIVNDLSADVADYEKTRYLLSAIGKKLAKENIKIRAGFYKGERAKTGLFLGA